jgi:predicted CoA-substrate-specific enzyme activase
MHNILGIDIGSVSVSVVVVGDNGEVKTSACAPHHGRSARVLEELLSTLETGDLRWVAKTSSTPESIQASATYDTQVALISAAQHRHARVGSILVLGGERFSLIRFDADGHYRDSRTNSSCAAGTGSFLDQQAKTLGLGDGADLAALALAAEGASPKIASRCAVFAKTDLIHAQQEGYSRAAIAKGLCQGLATIVTDTLLGGERPPSPVVLAGGVAKNRAVRAHLAELSGCELLVDEYAQLYGALGAALSLREELAAGIERLAVDLESLIASEPLPQPTFHPPLCLELSSYPDFPGSQRYEYMPPKGAPVEVDIYLPIEPGSTRRVVMGIDVGSTSTKAILLDDQRQVLAGFYSRTAGQPITAVQAILAAMSAWCREQQIALNFRGVGTTGSGRKLIGAIAGADLVVDEITAHARAAYELNPSVDTIIEIGGQDAKFTTLKNGVVTLSVMNTVCAAGTGSFIEEQARRLECSLHDYAERVSGARAPLASDRCTVFMQRDINHLLTRGYGVDQILATVLHSVRENYLKKVAREGYIGENICFQGATGKNRALVAAFEQKLNKPIWVSRYCHLTGALGVAYLLAERPSRSTSFRGLELYGEHIPVRNEVCELCRNHCKIVAADVRGKTVAYGFLCGRDYDIDHFVSSNKSGFDLLKARDKVLRPSRPAGAPSPVRVGIPVALYLVEELPLWRRFFDLLGVQVVTSEKCVSPVARGKRLAGAEFCAPMAAFHGHVAALLDEVDWVFAPIYTEAKHSDKDARRQYCYYSQYAGPLASTIAERSRLLRPLVSFGAVGGLQTIARLHAVLKPMLGTSFGWARVAAAFNDAVEYHEAGKRALREILPRVLREANDVATVLLGRPYTCLVPGMNKGIPDILARLGVKTFFQDMLSYDAEDVREIADLLGQVHWTYAARILEAACVVGKRDGLYPILVSSFKCAPDSCTIEFFRRIMDRAGKPYLILELDEHDSSIGYETRIEAAVRSFRNHHERGERATSRTPLSISPRLSRSLDGRTLFLPNWDHLSCELVAANLRREGVAVELLREDELSIQKSLRYNSGQCIPLNAIVEGFVGTVRARDLDPSRAALWMLKSQIACNLGMYPSYVKALLESYGEGFEKAAVFIGDLSQRSISTRAAINNYFAYMFGGMLRRMACRVRPYEMEAGLTDGTLAQGLSIFRQAFLGERDKLAAATEVVDRFVRIKTSVRNRFKVAVFGDLYTRDNEVMNQDLVRFIERHGGEVLTTPYSEYVKIIAEAYFGKWFREGKYLDVVANKSLLATVRLLERKYAQQFARVLGDIAPVRPTQSPQELLALFDVTDRHTGESMDNILKIFHILENHADVHLFVQANPAFCCPSLVSEAMAKRVEEVTGVPVVTVTYDGTVEPKNDALIPYLRYPRRSAVTAVRSSA